MKQQHLKTTVDQMSSGLQASVRENVCGSDNSFKTCFSFKLYCKVLIKRKEFHLLGLYSLFFQFPALLMQTFTTLRDSTVNFAPERTLTVGKGLPETLPSFVATLLCTSMVGTQHMGFP